MKTARFTPVFVLLIASTFGLPGERRAVAGDEEAPRSPEKLQSLLASYDQSHDPRWVAPIEQCAAQKGAIYSRIYWYTDLDEAKAAAAREHKPILYLRLLGKLSDEYSCANSRFFRTVLYANADVSKLLRERFICVWISERAVPVVTIDYGDGRVLKRTITGNSIHYVLNGRGQVIDALPGLFGPKAFAAILSRDYGVAKLAGATPEMRTRQIAQAEDLLLRTWLADSRQIDPEAPMPAVNALGALRAVEPATRPAGAGAFAAAPAAPLAMRRAVSKSAIEAPLLAEISPEFAKSVQAAIGNADDATWEKRAALHADQCRLDDASIAMMRAQNPAAYADPDRLARVVRRFEKLIALDTARDDFDYRRRVLSWLHANPDVSLDDLNARVYSEIFLTPRSDPWLGLAGQDSYSALDAEGCLTAQAK